MPQESSAQYISLEWSHSRILSTDSKVRSSSLLYSTLKTWQNERSVVIQLTFIDYKICVVYVNGERRRRGGNKFGSLSPTFFSPFPYLPCWCLPLTRGQTWQSLTPIHVPVYVFTALNAQIRVADRPMTKQGLTGMKTAAGRGEEPTKTLDVTTHFQAHRHFPI